MKKELIYGMLLASGSMAGHAAVGQDPRPNIVLINIDDMGWTDLSCNGSTYYETPNIDALRQSGVWFSQAYAGAANSAPSRACMLTGLNTPRHGMYTVGTSERGKSANRKLIPVKNSESLPVNIQLLPRVLQEEGYLTFHLGKWHVTSDPLKAGMDVNVGGFEAGHPRTYFSPYMNPALPDGPKGEFLCDRLGDEAVSLIKGANPSKPIFMYYATYAVHTPLQAKPELIKKYQQKTPTSAHDNPVYAALIESMDENVGKVISALRESGRMKNTVIIFTTDNGGVYKVSRQWPLRAGKGSFYEGGIRVPLIIYREGVYAHKEITNVPVSQMDLFPTILDCVGIDKKCVDLDGKSLINLVQNGKDEEFEERPLFWHFPAYLEGGYSETHDSIFRTTPVSVIRKGDWKLIHYYETGENELFNVANDISEKNELSSQNPSKCNELSAVLTQWLDEVHAPVNFELNPEYKSSETESKRFK